jgi:hypothetical protein
VITWSVVDRVETGVREIRSYRLASLIPSSSVEHLNAVDWNEVVLQWLTIEKDDLGLSAADRVRLIDNADRNNGADNTHRLILLLRRKPWIFDVLCRAPDAEVRWVNIHEADLPRLYIVPSNDWYLDTGRSFLLSDLPGNLQPDRSVDDGHGPWYPRHEERIEELQNRLADYDAKSTEHALVLIAPSEAGPYTIIDGNHRAGALCMLPNRRLPWRGILAVGPGIADSRWYANSAMAQAVMQSMEMEAGAGRLK